MQTTSQSHWGMWLKRIMDTSWNILRWTRVNLSVVIKPKGKYILSSHIHSLCLALIQVEVLVPPLSFFMLCTNCARVMTRLWRAGLPEQGWQQRSFSKCHRAEWAAHSRRLLAFTTFCDRCHQWTPVTIFLKCTQIKSYCVLDVKPCLLPWIIFVFMTLQQGVSHLDFVSFFKIENSCGNTSRYNYTSDINNKNANLDPLPPIINIYFICTLPSRPQMNPEKPVLKLAALL